MKKRYRRIELIKATIPNPKKNQQHAYSGRSSTSIYVIYSGKIVMIAIRIVVGKCIKDSRKAFLQSIFNVLAKVAITGKMYNVKIRDKTATPTDKYRSILEIFPFSCRRKRVFRNRIPSTVRIAIQIIIDWTKFSLNALKKVLTVPLLFPLIVRSVQ